MKRTLLTFALVAGSFVLATAFAADRDADLRAIISMPWNNSLIRADVPIFGVAAGENFKQYRLEYGFGRSPEEWHVIHISDKPQPRDPWEAGLVRWNPDSGAKGNLYTWRTGLTSYTYGQQVANLNGVRALRLVVEGHDGKTAETSIVVDIARVVLRESGGFAESVDMKAFVEVGPGAIDKPFGLISIQPIDPIDNPPLIQIKMPGDMALIGKIYEFRPPGFTVKEPCTFRMYFDGDDLANAGFDKTLPAEKLGIYAYLPIEERWALLPRCRVVPAVGEITVDVTKVTSNIAFYAIMADVTPPEPPVFRAVPSELERRQVVLSGTVEPLTTLEIYRLPDGERVLTQTIDGSGRFTTPPLALAVGENTFAAKAIDGANNVSGASETIRITRKFNPPKTVEDVRILGKLRAERGDRLLVRLTGEDSDDKVNVAYARLFSETDAQGFELELVETGSKTGIYVATFSIGEASDPERSIIAASRTGEMITVASVQDETKIAVIEFYTDVRPPLAPLISSPTHPSLCQNTFQNCDDPLGEWANIDDRFGARLSLESEGANSYLKLTKQQPQSHLGAIARRTSYRVADFPLISFDYRILPEVRMDMEVLVRGQRRLVNFNDHDARERRKPAGSFEGIVSDGRWRRAELDLRGVLTRYFTGDGDIIVEEVRFINWDVTAYRKFEYGKTGPVGASWNMDNFRILRYGGSEATFNWPSRDSEAVAGYSYVLDREPNTVTPETVTGDYTTRTYSGLDDGQWYFHVRAAGKQGGWGPTNHYKILVDTTPPTAALAVNAVGGRLNWDAPIVFSLDDGEGAGVDSASIRLTVDGIEYNLLSETLEFDGSLLTFNPVESKSGILLFADGKTVNVALAASDYAENAMKEPLTWSYVSTSPLKIIPPDPDGQNGWYITPPSIEMKVPPGATAHYSWAITPEEDELFQRGNSINVLTVRVRGVDGKEEIYTKQIKLDSTVPTVTARTIDTPQRVIVLEHDDFATVSGGLTCKIYESNDLSGNPQAILKNASLLLSNRSVPQDILRRTGSVEWSGMLRPPANGIHRFILNFGEHERVKLVVNGETLLDSANAPPEQRSISTELTLTRRMIPVSLRWYGSANSISPPRINLRWRNPASQGRDVILTASDMFMLKSLAEIFYRWNDDADWIKYTESLQVPAGKNTLHYYAVDEAGNRSEEKYMEVEN